MPKGNTKTLREMNKALILGLIRSQGPISRADIAKLTGLTRAATSAIVSDLSEEGAVVTVGMGDNWTGRKPVLYEYNARNGFVVGVDIGGTNIHCAVADMAGVVLWKTRLNTPTGVSRSELITYLLAQVEQCCTQANLEPTQLKAIGVASPGVVDHATGRVLGAAPNLPEWADLPLGDLIQERFGVSVLVDNDVHCALVGEAKRGAAANCRNAAFINISTGLGGALMLDGRLYRGTHWFAGEIGYWMVGRDSLHGQWGSRGCLETHTAGPGIVERVRHRLADYPQSSLAVLGSNLSAEAVFEAARSGDRLADLVVEETVEYLGFTVVNLAVLLDLEVIVLGGGVMRSADLLLAKIEAYVQKHVPVPPRVTVSHRPDEASVLGAIDIAIDTLREGETTGFAKRAAVHVAGRPAGRRSDRTRG